MSRLVPYLVTFVLFAAACGNRAAPPAEPGPEAATPAPAPEAAAPAEVFVGDLSGTWKYTTSNRHVMGMCPAGADTSGTSEVKEADGKLTFAFVSGQTCQPASMCSYAGTVADGHYTVGNSDTVDDEGGKVTNALQFAAISATAAKGTGTSTYTHPGGMQCTWSYDIQLTK